MFTKTSAIQKNDYFTSVKKLPVHTSKTFTVHKKNINYLFYLHQSVTIQAISGIAMLIIGKDLEQASSFDRFFLHGTVRLHKGCYYNIISVSPECTVCLHQTRDNAIESVTLPHPIHFTEIMPSFEVSKIYSLYYQVKKAPYHYPHHQHPYYEMTIVEKGILDTSVDGKHYRLHDHDVMIYNSQQIHDQTITTEHATSYITIMFEMTLNDPTFFNRIFHLGTSALTQLEDIVTLSNQLDDAYQKDRLLAMMKLFILSLPQQRHFSKSSLTNAMQEKYDNERLQQMIDYVRYHPAIKVADLVDHFSISRSSLQALFLKHLKQTPKAYLKQQRFKQAKTLIRESSYTLNEIAQFSGYQSIQAFSRAFKKYYHESPSHYAKSVYKV